MKRTLTHEFEDDAELTRKRQTVQSTTAIKRAPPEESTDDEEPLPETPKVRAATVTKRINPYEFTDDEERCQKLHKVHPTIRSLSRTSLTLSHSYITEVLAFPRSLAVLSKGILPWNASCWLHQLSIPDLALTKIANHCQKRVRDIQIC